LRDPAAKLDDLNQHNPLAARRVAKAMDLALGALSSLRRLKETDPP
jgi:hypothetical protein